MKMVDHPAWAGVRDVGHEELGKAGVTYDYGESDCPARCTLEVLQDWVEGVLEYIDAIIVWVKSIQCFLEHLGRVGHGVHLVCD
jgi:hypothetical protein